MKRSKLKIMLIAPIFLPISRNLTYGGIERVISFLDTELIRMDMESYVVAPSDSEVYGKLIPTLEKHAWAITGYTIKSDIFSDLYEKHYETAIDYAIENGIDVLHDHTGKIIGSKAYKIKKHQINFPILITLHGSANNEKMEIYRDYKTPNQKVFFNAISKSQKRLFSEIVSVDTVIYNGLDVENYPYSEQKMPFLLSLGRLSQKKGQDLAIRTAKELGMKLVIAGNVHEADKEFYAEEIRPHLDMILDEIPYSSKWFEGYILPALKEGQIIHTGGVNDAQKKELYKHAQCFLMPIRWDEPFGLVMIEALACGTPVVAINRGSVPEIVEHGFNGYVVQDSADLANHIRQLNNINPRNCRNTVETKFSTVTNAESYVSLYNRIISTYNARKMTENALLNPRQL
ncbi:hypothetical protein DRJ17_03695 [Candidatus Woesearchaeota archaeon]|nr:MAG: hypothetical protein DRJ17_03695 [Candidatus Woesearchaeota archaeon]